MNFKLEKISELSGNKTAIYSVILKNEEQSLFERFLAENQSTYRTELNNILQRLVAIGHDVGARAQFFKLEEGTPGDMVCALYDDPDSKLRLYGMRFGMTTIILGGGGPKSKKIRAWQQDEKLSKHAKEMIAVSKQIYDRIKEKDIKWASNELDLEGDLTFNEEDENE
ncbi:hypothetical protein EON73_01950 [bacterium]|nr:MAG: hypothetical protein EON73_01950 [bacterium]